MLANAASRQKWLIDSFDEDTAILHRLPFAISTILRAAASRSAKGLPLDKFHAAIVISSAPCCSA
ncbi:hypothetical protein QA640_32445 [Bradyrhizobium sp. CB82]|uniref:hypothetical protein n=1 Tax=Bradyrhizobium sp. CB82 TaxID=3039159 RepID=UPI0024B284C9|nr:hypothetical protein [Bradyrhizobium sp. CB82]WFU39069.1 hypothetical protein QA640_32445 [Bradyrhizobium sp. CB82]